MVGDATAIAGQPIEEMGLHIGRLFNALTSGTSAGEAVARLQEVGLITGIAKNQFEALAAAQKKGTQPILTQKQALTLLQNVMSQTSGAMAKLSETTEGKLSNMADAVSQFKVAFGTGLNDGVKAASEALSNGFAGMQKKAEMMGKLIGAGIKNAVDGDLSLLIKIGQLVGDAIVTGVKLSARSIGGEILGGIAGIADSIAEFGHIDKDLGGASFRKDITAANRELVSSQLEVAMFELAESFREMTSSVAKGDAFKANMEQQFHQGRRAGDFGNSQEINEMLSKLERIARAVDKPFPN
jgi:hypothetical protein